MFQVLSLIVEDNEYELEDRCGFLVSVMESNDSACCTFPSLEIFNGPYRECENNCTAKYGEEAPCCPFACCLTALGVITTVNDENGNFLSADINVAGIIKSFLSSVDNDLSWEPVLSDSVTRCNDQYGAPGDGYDCGNTPKNFYKVVDCSYVQNFMTCPDWNPSGLEGCQYRMEFYSKCIGAPTDVVFAI